MPRRAGTDVYRVSVRGAGRVAADFDRRRRELQDLMVGEIRQLGIEALEVLRGYAPEDTKDLVDHIIAVPFFGRAASPRASVRVEPLAGHRGAERDDYDYLGVTRHGHRRGTIVSPQNRPLKVHYAGHRNPAVFVWRSSVPGAEAGSIRGGRRGDWVEAASADLERLNDHAADRLGRQIRARIL